MSIFFSAERRTQWRQWSAAELPAKSSALFAFSFEKHPVMTLMQYNENREK
jgi:hypothetical protein